MLVVSRGRAIADEVRLCILQVQSQTGLLGCQKGGEPGTRDAHIIVGFTAAECGDEVSGFALADDPATPAELPC
jgi:hypothetical protein